MSTIIIEMIMAFMACFFFAIVYNTPKKELIFCGIFGGLGYGVYSVSYTHLGYARKGKTTRYAGG